MTLIVVIASFAFGVYVGSTDRWAKVKTWFRNLVRDKVK